MGRTVSHNAQGKRRESDGLLVVVVSLILICSWNERVAVELGRQQLKPMFRDTFTHALLIFLV